MKGFKFAGIHAGIKKNGQKDLGLIFCEKPATAAAMFTRNKVVAAPVILGRETIKKGKCQALVVNSGNANCFTGSQGLLDARATAGMVANIFDIPENLVMVSSTGMIGAPLPMDRFKTGIPLLQKEISTGCPEDFAQAILTTDTCRKIVRLKGSIDTPQGPEEFNLMGVAKGSGMIRPDMATMLAYILTDADIAATDLHSALAAANEKSFNRITVDGDTSTNDTLLCLASGAGGACIRDDADLKVFQSILERVCFDLGKMIVKDGEGATKVIQITVRGAKTREDAFKASEAIAHSNLVKTAIYGEDPNWGRITAAAGRSGAFVDPDKMDLYFGTVPLVIRGCWLGPEAEKKAAQVMKASEINISLDLNLGDKTDSFLFCDFSENYVKINADYRS
ncbi:MAG: bifunctional glutamate N-acetyltransferase/amino-acid acetyltransferase ArgJ [Desulfobacteraceae bacterium]|nr:bifunctional glutamate N-acetyltransferase/amino-acid acetyltransferase ArgJ [Desulfobacteraceae bacterium]